VMVTGPPAFTPVATPEALIVAMAVFDDVQFTLTAPVVPSEKWPVAVNGCVSPAATLVEAGATVIVCSVAAVTVSCAVPLIAALAVEVAVMVTGPPAFTPVATPEVLIVAIVLSDEVQFTLTAPVVPSEKWPVAVNGCVRPAVTLAEVGATVIVCNVAAVTVSCAVPLIAALVVEVAVMVTGPPAFTPVATPEALIVAIVLSDEVQFTLTAPVVPSEKWPVAVNGCVSPAVTLAEVGATVIVCNVAAVTVSCAVPLIAALAVEVAVMVTGPPAFTPVATPEALIVAMAVFDDVQFTPTAPVVPSEKWPVAVNGCVSPAATLVEAGATVIVCSVAAVTVSCAVPLIAALAVEVAVMVTGPPAFTPVATPEVLIVAIVLSDEVQFTLTAPVVPSEKWPVAVNGCVRPVETLAEVGATVIVCNVAAVTVSCAVPLIAALAVEVAVMVTGPPALTPVATPEALIVAIVLSDEVQFTLTAPVVPSEKWPVAVNGCVRPAETLADVGATVIVCRTTVTLIAPDVPVIAGVTVSVAVTLWVPAVFNVTGKIPVPLTRVVFAGSVACPSVLVK